MNKIISKSSPSQEAKYQAYLSDEKVGLARLMCVVSGVLFLAFIVVDIWALPSAFSTAVMIRGVVVSFLLVTFLITYTRYFEKYYEYIVSAMYIVAVSGIEAMVFIAVPTDQAYETYFVGVILILITLFTWTYLKLRTAVPLAVLSIVAYAYIEATHRDLIENGNFSALIANIFFLGSASILGFIGQVKRNKYLFQNYELAQSLKVAVKEKTMEADDYAYKANHDALTSLPNRRYMIQLLNEGLEVAKEKDKILAILFFDLNGFKPLNDTYGHAVGDEVLTIVAKRLELAIRRGDCVSRLGGDEYLVGLMMDKEHVHEIELMAEKFSAIISEPMNVEGNLVKVGVSVGIAAYPMHGNNVDVLIDIADKKMYKVKQGKGREVKNVEPEPEPVVVFPGNSRKRR